MMSLCLSMVLAASARVWVEPSWVDVMDAARGQHASRSVRADGAPGDWVSFQVVVASGDAPVSEVTLAAPRLPGLPDPVVRRVGMVGGGSRSARAWGGARYRPDPLLPPLPVRLAPDTYAVFWVTYPLPPDVAPGRRSGTLRVQSPDRKRDWRVPVRITVHPFTPPPATLPLLAPVDPEVLSMATGVDPAPAEFWAGLGEFLAAFGLQAWLTAPAPGAPEDARWLAGALDGPATLRLADGRRIALDGVRLDAGAADAFAVGLAAWSVELAETLAAGAPLRARPPLAAAARVEPEEAAPIALALDGSPFTVWRQDARRDRTVIELDLPESARLSAIALWCPPGHEPGGVELHTARAGAPFSPARTRWDFRPPDYAYGLGHAVGTLRYPQDAQALRLVLPPNAEGRPLALAELVLNPGDAGEHGADEAAPGAAGGLWLRVDAHGFPSSAADAHPGEVRMLGWLCHGQRFAGAVLPPLTAFPPAWNATAGGSPLVWELPPDADAPLCYPAPGGLLPSVRLMRLREGARDHAWLTLLAQMAAAGRVVDPEALALAGARLYNPHPDAAALRAMLESLPKHRAVLARALTRAAADRGGGSR